MVLVLAVQTNRVTYEVIVFFPTGSTFLCLITQS